MSGFATYAEDVAAYMCPTWQAAAHPADGTRPDPVDVTRWIEHVANVAWTLRAAAAVGGRAVKEATTLLAVTGTTEGELLIAVAEHHGEHEVAEQLGVWLDQLRARGPDGRPLISDPTAPLAVVVDLAAAAAARRTS